MSDGIHFKFNTCDLELQSFLGAHQTRSCDSHKLTNKKGQHWSWHTAKCNVLISLEILSAILKFVIRFVSNCYNWCVLSLCTIQWKKNEVSILINCWDTVNYSVSRPPFVRYLGICNRICVKLLQLMCAVITHNSVKKNEVSILINGYVTANPPSWSLLSDLCQTFIDYVQCYSTQFKKKRRIYLKPFSWRPQTQHTHRHRHRHKHTHKLTHIHTHIHTHIQTHTTIA